jgi:hypothetical protein
MPARILARLARSPQGGSRAKGHLSQRNDRQLFITLSRVLTNYVIRPQVRMIFFGLTFSASTSSGVSASSIETASTATFPCANAE